MSNNTETFIIKLKDQVSAGLKSAGKNTDKLKDKTSGLADTYSRLSGILGGLSFAYIGNEIVQSLSEFEKFDAVLTNTLGSNSAAQKAMQDISDFAASTPFAVDRLTGAYVKLANQGFVATTNQMRKLGDLASSTGKDFDQLAEAIIDGQIGEFERLKEFGIRASKQGDRVKFTFKGVTKEVAFTESAMRSYILSLGDVAGVSGSMAAISKATGGQISNLGDKITQLYITIGQKLKPAISGTISALAGGVDSIAQFAEWVSKGSAGVDLLVTALGAVTGGVVAYKSALMAWSVAGRVVAGVQFLITTATAAQVVALNTGSLATKAFTLAQVALKYVLMANPIGLVVVSLGVLAGAFAAAWNTSDKFRNTLKGVWSATKVFGGAFIDLFTSIPMLVVDAFNAVPKAIFDVLGGVFSAFKALLTGNFSAIPNIIKDALTGNAVANVVGDFANKQKDAGKRIKSAFNEGYNAENKAKAFSFYDAQAKQKNKDRAFSFYDAMDAGKNKGKRDGENKSLVTGLGSGATGVVATGKSKGLGSGVSEIKASAPKNFTINISSLIKEQNINTTNLTESMGKIKEAVTNVLLTAVSDSQIVAE